MAVSETDRWLSDYGDSHADITNPGIYWLSVPILVLGTVGMLWSLPIPEEFVKISPVLNWGSAFLMVAVGLLLHYLHFARHRHAAIRGRCDSPAIVAGSLVVFPGRGFERTVCSQHRRPLSWALP